MAITSVAPIRAPNAGDGLGGGLHRGLLLGRKVVVRLQIPPAGGEPAVERWSVAELRSGCSRNSLSASVWRGYGRRRWRFGSSGRWSWSMAPQPSASLPSSRTCWPPWPLGSANEWGLTPWRKRCGRTAPADGTQDTAGTHRSAAEGRWYDGNPRRSGGYLLDPDQVEVDAERISQLLGEARQAIATGHASDVVAVLSESHRAFRGAPYADVPDAAVPAGEVQRLHDGTPPSSRSIRGPARPGRRSTMHR